jgi:hypothetical protein
VYENWKYRPLATVTDRDYLDTTLDESSRYVIAGNLAGLPGPFSNRAFAPWLVQPRAVVLQPNGRRSVLDPQNGYALIRQDETGTFLENFASVHNHLEFSRYMAIDNALDRLVISHPGDFYTTRQSVKVTDLDGQIVLEIGDTGSSPGMFQDPAGVAVDSASRILVADSGNSRVQVFAPDGSFLAAIGEPGSGPGQFDDLRGLTVDSGGQVLVCDGGNQRVAVLQFDGSALSWSGEIAGMADPVAVANGFNGEVLVSDAGTDAILVYDSDLEYERSLTEPLGYFGGTLDNPGGLVAVDAEHVVVCDTGNRRLATLRINGVTDVDYTWPLPAQMMLRPVRPSPFANLATITFELPADSQVDLNVYDVGGRRVRRLHSGWAEAGVHTMIWDGRDDRLYPSASGVYFIRLESASAARLQRVVHLK